MRKASDMLPANHDLRKRMTRIISWGVFSVIIYLAIFLNQPTINKYFTSGGVFALVTVATALAFALIHGTFASHVLENLNFRAANRKKEEH